MADTDKNSGNRKPGTPPKPNRKGKFNFYWIINFFMIDNNMILGRVLEEIVQLQTLMKILLVSILQIYHESSQTIIKVK